MADGITPCNHDAGNVARGHRGNGDYGQSLAIGCGRGQCVSGVPARGYLALGAAFVRLVVLEEAGCADTICVLSTPLSGYE